MASAFGWICFACVFVVVVLLEVCRRRDETPARTLARFPLRFLPRCPEGRHRRAGDLERFVLARSGPGPEESPGPGSPDLLPVFRDVHGVSPADRRGEMAGAAGREARRA
jgi:hypothetical protein